MDNKKKALKTVGLLVFQCFVFYFLIVNHIGGEIFLSCLVYPGSACFTGFLRHHHWVYTLKIKITVGRIYKIG